MIEIEKIKNATLREEDIRLFDMAMDGISIEICGPLQESDYNTIRYIRGLCKKYENKQA